MDSKEKVDMNKLAQDLMPILEDKFINEYERNKFKEFKEHYLSDDFYLVVSFVNGFTKLSLIQKFLKTEDGDYTDKVKKYLESVEEEVKIRELKRMIDEYFWIGGGIGSTAIRREVQIILNSKKEIITDFVGFFESVIGLED